MDALIDQFHKRSVERGTATACLEHIIELATEEPHNLTIEFIKSTAERGLAALKGDRFSINPDTRAIEEAA